MSNDRLRRLDALFAERVLGCEVIRNTKPYSNGQAIGKSHYVGCGCKDRLHGQNECEGFCSNRDCTNPGHQVSLGRLEHINYNIDDYTRSLNAAWEGMRKIAISGRSDIINFGLCFQHYHGEISCYAVFTDVAGAYPDKYPTFNSTRKGEPDTDIHPAEALVLACLRAVGCSEEELT